MVRTKTRRWRAHQSRIEDIAFLRLCKQHDAAIAKLETIKAPREIRKEHAEMYQDLHQNHFREFLELLSDELRAKIQSFPMRRSAPYRHDPKGSDDMAELKRAVAAVTVDSDSDPGYDIYPEEGVGYVGEDPQEWVEAEELARRERELQMQELDAAEEAGSMPSYEEEDYACYFDTQL